MAKKKHTATGLITVLIIIAAAILLIRHFHIKNFHTVEPEVLYVSGQPKGMDYTRLLYKYHVATIVNVRSSAEHRERNWHNEEITWVRKNGVELVELPIDRNNYFPDKKTQQFFISKIMSNRLKLPVLLHGSGGEKRVPMLTAAWLIKAKGYSVEQTLDIVDRLNDDREISTAEREFIYNLHREAKHR